MEAPIDILLTVPFDEFFTTVSHALGNGSGHPGWIMKFHVRVGNEVAILFEIMGNADHFPMSLDNQTVEMRHVEADKEVFLRLKSFQQVMGFQEMFNGDLKKRLHSVSRKRMETAHGRPPFQIFFASAADPIFISGFKPIIVM